jgi:hypothetical protein
LRVPQGRYFLGELLPVTVWLTNHTSSPVGYAGYAMIPNLCDSTFWVSASGGGTPQLSLPFTGVPSCPSPGGIGSLATATRLVAHALVPLTASGQLRLVSEVEALTGTKLPGARRLFANGGPSPTIRVSPAVPADRVLYWVSAWGMVFPLQHGALVHEESMSCGVGPGSWWGTTTEDAWPPIKGFVLHRPAVWRVLLGAAGYEIASGRP